MRVSHLSLLQWSSSLSHTTDSAVSNLPRRQHVAMLHSSCYLLAAFAAVSATTFDTLASSDYMGTVEADDSISEAIVTTTSTIHVQYSIRNGQLRSRGVNLGSWLVAEKWMTSSADFWKESVNASHGEYTAIAQATDPDAIRLQLEYHHSTFINESDIADIAAIGINTIRVPIGYWIVGFDNDDPSGKAEWKVFTKGTLKYLDLLVTVWAKKHNVAVLLSIHAAKGSQNGADHSSPSVYGTDFWASFAENVNNTISMVSYLAERYKDEEAFLGFALLNEPSGKTTTKILYDYYERAYSAIRATGSECVLTVAPLLYEQSPDVLTDFMLAPKYTNVWVEWHPYFVWGYDDVSDQELVNTSVKVKFQNDVTQWNSVPGHNQLFIGEWCFATNGKFTNNSELFYQFAQAQTVVVNQAEGGWTYWSWRIYDDEASDNMWSLRAVLRNKRLKDILFPSGSRNPQHHRTLTSVSSSTSTYQTQQQLQL